MEAKRNVRVVPEVNQRCWGSVSHNGGPAQRVCYRRGCMEINFKNKGTKTWRDIFLKPKSLPKSSYDFPNSALLRSPDPWECYLLFPSMLDYERPAPVPSGLVKDISLGYGLSPRSVFLEVSSSLQQLFHPSHPPTPPTARWPPVKGNQTFLYNPGRRRSEETQ